MFFVDKRMDLAVVINMLTSIQTFACVMFSI